MNNVISNEDLEEVVVENATSQSTPKVTPSSVLKSLEKKRVEWQEGSYRKSNTELYALLADCLSYAGDLSVAEAKERNKALQDFHNERGYQWRKDTPLITKVVRAVFGTADRRRISTYSLVLRQAKNEKVLISNLPKWIEDMGGLQEIKLSLSPNFVSPKDKAEIAQTHIESSDVLAEVKTEALSLLADAEYVGEDCVLIAKQQADGSFKVRALVRSGSAVNAAFTALYAKQKAEKDEQSKNTQAANQADGNLAKAA